MNYSITNLMIFWEEGSFMSISYLFVKKIKLFVFFLIIYI